MAVVMKNPSTGELREIKVGWNWVLFLLSGFFGIPLFLRRLNTLGAMFVGIWAINFIAPAVLASPEEVLGLQVILFFVVLGLGIWLGVKGNELTAKNYLEKGWTFVNPDSDDVKRAKTIWGIAV